LRLILESYRGRLLGEISDTRRRARGEPRHPQASDVFDIGLCSARGMKKEAIQRIDQALRRLDAGEYGFCSRCGQEINDRRLLTLPFAVRCRDCEQFAEVARQHGARRHGERVDEASA
jgi:DnaK suppressor protein